jgi:aldehyde dehydrogenase (NAD+)
VRDSGKTQVDAMIGEVLTTCEKLKWTIANGEKYLKDEPRDVGALMVMKKVHASS